MVFLTFHSYMAGISALMGEIFGLKTKSLIENSYESVLPILDKLPYFFLFSPLLLSCHLRVDFKRQALQHYMGGLWTIELLFWRSQISVSLSLVSPLHSEFTEVTSQR